MDLMTLAAKITLDDSSYTKGISNAEKMGQALAGKMSAMTVAVGNLAADMIRKGVNGIQQVIGGAINGYADYEQLIGGVETLFKKSSDKVAKYAKQSFKTTGLSANEYMETVTSFSASLLQGLGGDTEQAADLANMAITDMADNANKMGTDISSIQAAYQGFAKQNYTMLDNLKLGYGGTASEMVRLINDSKILDHEIKDLDGITFDQIIEAIHKIQEEMGVTGTTAKEAAETISGSKASLKAAWEDLLSAVGGEGGQERLDQTLENFKTSFTAYMENFIPTLVKTISNSGTLVEGIADAIADLPTDLLSKVAEAGVDAGTDMISGVSKITSWLIESITNMFKSASADPSQIADLGAAIGEFLGTAISDIVKNAPAIIEGIIDVGVSLAGGLIEGLFKGLFGEGNEVDEITDELGEKLTDVDVKNAKATALVKYLESLDKEFGESAKNMREFKQAKAELEEIMPEAGKVFEKYGNDIGAVTKKLEELLLKQREVAIRSALMDAVKEEYNLLANQMAQKEKANAAVNMYTAENKGIQDTMIKSLQGYVTEWLDMFGEGANPAVRQEIENIQNGKVFENGALVDLSQADPSTLLSLISSYGAAIDKGEGQSVWDQDIHDDIISPDALSELASEIEKNAKKISDAEAEAAEAQKQMDATEKQIAITETAVHNAMKQADVDWREAADYVNTGGNAVLTAMQGLADKLSSISILGWVSPFSHAKGAWDVPYDNYPALLHRDERVLTASQARKENSGASVDLNGIFDTVRNAIQEGMSGVSVNSYLNGRNVTDDVSRNMARELKARRFRP